MLSNRTEFFIARRLASRSPEERKSVMVRIASATVAVGTAVMILSLAVISGFRSELTKSLLGFGAEIEIVSYDGRLSAESSPIYMDRALEEAVSELKGFGAIAPYTLRGGMLRGEESVEGVILKGAGPDFDWSFFAGRLVAGELPDLSDSLRTKDILISRSLSDKAMLDVGSRAEIIVVEERGATRRDLFRVGGIYSSGYEELDDVMIMCDMRAVQRINGWSSNQITGYEVRLERFGRLERFYRQLDGMLLSNAGCEELIPVSITERNPYLFDWLKAHNVNAVVIITIMLVVALFNMASALLILLLERTSMIGVLKALGMNNGSVRRLFVMRSMFIVLRGMVAGNISGIILCLAQKWGHIVKLDAGGYLLSEVPIEFGWWIVWLNAGCFALMALLLALPAMITSRITPDTTMRYQ